MGVVKAKMMEWDDLGLCGGNGGYICGECIGDHALAEFISQNADECECKYCQRRNETPFACHLSDVVEHMAEVIKEEWTDPANELPYESREGGYQGDTYDAWDMLGEIGFDPENSNVFDDVASYFMGRDWCREDYFAATPFERSRWGWERFCREVKHARRYTFWSSFEDGNPEDHPDHLPPARMLAEIEDVVHTLSLVREFPLGTQFWRVQDHAIGDTLQVPDRFTSPPLEFATQPNRMTPAGISMFYGAEDFDTAVLEVAGKEKIPGRAASGIAFETCREMHILDLIYLKQGVSYFAPNGREWRHRSQFLRFFTREVSKPIQRDKRQHIDYVPTQVFTEYVRYHIASASNSPVDGIRYFSSRNGHPCVVLFCDDEDCLRDRDGRPQMLRAIPNSLRTISLEDER